jgi:5'-nucleotidase
MSREMDFRFGREFVFDGVARFTARLVERLSDHPISAGTLLNINCPGRTEEELAGAQVTRLGKRVYRDKLELQEEDESGRPRRRYRIYGMEPSYRNEPGTDFAAIDAGVISVTPLHFELTDMQRLDEMADWDLSALLGSSESLSQE